VRVAIVNNVWDPLAATPAATLTRFTTLTGWARAIGANGVTVAVFQRFHTTARLDDGARYEFIADRDAPRPPAWFRGSRALDAAVAAWTPDVVHINGLDYSLAIRALARAVGSSCAIAVQDHGGFDPRQLSPPRRIWMRWGLRAASALLVATPPQVDEMRGSGLAPPGLRIRDVMEGSTMLRADPSRAPHTPVALLWVARLNENKDPLTVLRGFELWAARRPDAALTFVYQDAALERAVREAVASSAPLRDRVELAGAVSHDRLQTFYERADLFVVGSHHEGSGYAALEAMACGVVPVLTDIPSFRWLTDEGRVGALWTPGDPHALCAAIEQVATRPLEPQRRAARDRFDASFSWDAIGRRAVAIYRELCRA
jgi:glycosyltransferase involved in cell wall biosynthesis